jgi:hypothetical protein
MKRRLRIVNAILERWFYLLTRGMWRYEVSFTVIGGDPERILFIATTYIAENRKTIGRVFYAEEGPALDDYIRLLEEKLNSL